MEPLQDRANRCVFEQGLGVTARPDVLAGYDLAPGELTPEILERARAYCTRRVVDGMDAGKKPLPNRAADDNINGGMHKAASQRKRCSMQVQENELRDLLTALGFDGSDHDKWSLKRLQQKVASGAKLKELLTKATKEPEGEQESLLKNIADALSEGEGVEVIGSAPASAEEGDEKMTQHETNGHGGGTATLAAPAKAGKKGSTKAKKGGKAAPAKKREAGMSLLEAAATVVRGSKKPLSVGDIFETIQTKGLWTPGKGKTPKATMAAGIYTEIGKKGKDSRFKQVERGLFAANK